MKRNRVVVGLVAFAAMLAVCAGVTTTAFAGNDNGNNGNGNGNSANSGNSGNNGNGNSGNNGNGNGNKAADPAAPVCAKGSGSSFDIKGWQNTFDMADGATVGVAYWHFVDSGTNANKTPSATSMTVQFVDAAGVDVPFIWSADKGFSTNGGGKNPGWVIVTPIEWTLDLANTCVNTALNQFNLSGYTKVPAPVALSIVPEIPADPLYVDVLAYYVWTDGRVLSTTLDTQILLPGQCIDWSIMDADLTAWIEKGGLDQPHTGFVTSGSEPITVGDHAKACYEDFGPGQYDFYTEFVYGVHEVDLDPGFVLPEVLVQFDRYLADVSLWNDLYAAFPYLTTQEGNWLHDEGGMAHYNALLAAFGADDLPPYWHFEWDGIDKYTMWAEALEVGLKHLLDNHEELGIDLTAFQERFDANTFIANTNK